MSPRLPPRGIRRRLTLLYGGLFLASGAALLAITFVLVRQATGGDLVTPKAHGDSVAPAAQLRRDRGLADRQHDEDLRVLVEKSGTALAIMTGVSILLGWLVAGRMLQPLRTITGTAREISTSNLDRRLALTGPDDELKQLADTFDDLLGRLEASFAAQRQFVANASHELRTPLTLQRALLELALTDPNASTHTLRRTCEKLLAKGEQQERLIEALLTLSRSQRGLDQRERLDLAAIADGLLAARRPQATQRSLSIRTTLLPAETRGDPRLAERLVANLIDNALHYNHEHGHIDVATTTSHGRVQLSVANSGPLIAQDHVEQLFQPFQRLGADRTDHGDGVGLGLSIVTAIAAAHHATVAAHARPDGGLQIDVGFPAADTTPDRPAAGGRG
jgi:signal transduction histidine kinase